MRCTPNIFCDQVISLSVYETKQHITALMTLVYWANHPSQTLGLLRRQTQHEMYAPQHAQHLRYRMQPKAPQKYTTYLPDQQHR